MEQVFPRKQNKTEHCPTQRLGLQITFPIQFKQSQLLRQCWKTSCAICLGYLPPVCQCKLHISVSSRSTSTARDQWLKALHKSTPEQGQRNDLKPPLHSSPLRFKYVSIATHCYRHFVFFIGREAENLSVALCVDIYLFFSVPLNFQTVVLQQVAKLQG